MLSRRDFNRGVLYGIGGLLLGSSGGCGEDLEAILKSGKTDKEGVVFFTDEGTKLPIVVAVIDENSTAIADANVTFIDNTFNAFAIVKEGYTRHFQVFNGGTRQSGLRLSDAKQSLNGFVNYIFTLHSGRNTDSTIFNHENNEALLNFEQWALTSSEYTFNRCMTKEEVMKARNYTFELLSYVIGETSFFKVVSSIYDTLIHLEETGLVKDLVDEKYFIFEPRNPTLPPLMIGISRAEVVPEEVREQCGVRLEKAIEPPNSYLFHDEFSDAALQRTLWVQDANVALVERGHLTLKDGYIRTAREIVLPPTFTLTYKLEMGDPSKSACHVLLENQNGRRATGFHSFIRDGQIGVECIGGARVERPFDQRETVMRFQFSNGRVNVYLDDIHRGQIPCPLSGSHFLRIEEGRNNPLKMDYVRILP